jgi:hypothetical protein
MSTASLVHDLIRLTTDATEAATRSAPLPTLELEAVVEASLSSINTLRAINDRYEDRRRRDKAPLDRAFVEAVHHAAIDWYNSATHLLKLVDDFEATGATLANSGEFRDACRSSYIIGFNADTLREAEAQFARGEFRRLEDVLDEVRTRTVR